MRKKGSQCLEKWAQGTHLVELALLSHCVFLTFDEMSVKVGDDSCKHKGSSCTRKCKTRSVQGSEGCQVESHDWLNHWFLCWVIELTHSMRKKEEEEETCRHRERKKGIKEWWKQKERTEGKDKRKMTAYWTLVVYVLMVDWLHHSYVGYGLLRYSLQLCFVQTTFRVLALSCLHVIIIILTCFILLFTYFYFLWIIDIYRNWNWNLLGTEHTY
jgi:hypothetical protein